MEFEAHGFTSLNDTFDWAQNNDFDVALIDYYLKDGLLGIDALKKLRTIKGNSFKAIVLSNHVDDQQAKELLDAGFVSIMTKPFSMEKFKECIGIGA